MNEQALPLLIEADDDVDFPAWIALNRQDLRAKLYRHGALLLRSGPWADFSALVHAFTDRLVDYRGGAAIRSRVNADTYTASEYPSELEIRLHSEFCYSNDWPMLLFFHCAEIGRDCGGQTPIADNRRILAQIPASIRNEFVRRGLTYMRGYGFNRTWQRSYETESREEVEAICAREGRRCEWLSHDRLRSYETRVATRSHPVTGEDIWFNYAHGFHLSRMDDGIRAALSTSAEDTDQQLWPNNVFWADGSPIDPQVIATANEVVGRNAVQFDWQLGDTLIVDNMLCSHGRRPYTGARRILLKMAESHLEAEPCRKP
jgi:alpha-ketoglutarate-dependent taurine dioxygenase